MSSSATLLIAEISLLLGSGIFVGVFFPAPIVLISTVISALLFLRVSCVSFENFAPMFVPPLLVSPLRAAPISPMLVPISDFTFSSCSVVSVVMEI